MEKDERPLPRRGKKKGIRPGKLRRMGDKAKKLARNQKIRMLISSVFDSNASEAALVGAALLALGFLERLSRPAFLIVLVACLLALGARLDARRRDLERQLKRRLELERSFNTVETPKESAYWLNKFVKAYWQDALEPLLADVLYKRLSKMIQKARPSFVKQIDFDAFTLGTSPPRLDNFRILGRTGNVEPGGVGDSAKSLEFDVDFTATDFRWVLRAVGGDEYKIIKNANFTFSIVSLEIRLRIRLYLFDSSNIALLSLVQKPDIYTFHANLLGISQRSIPFFDIRKFLESVISQALVEPQRVPVPLSFKGVPQVSDSVVSFDVVGCSGIKIIDRSVTRRLQLRVRIGPYMRKSAVAEGEEPEFNETFEAKINATKLKIVVKLLDVTGTEEGGSSWECIGEKMIEMTCSQKDTTTYWLKDSSGMPLCRTMHDFDKEWRVTSALEAGRSTSHHESGDFGHVTLVLRPVQWAYFDERDGYQGGKKSRDSRAEPQSYALRVSRARDLMAKDSNGLSDPYFKVKYGAFAARSETCFRTLNPVWSETFVFERSHTTDVIKIKFWDKDKIQDESLGYIDIPVRLVHQGNRKFAEWRELKGADSGEVFYELSLRKGLPQAVRSRGITVQAEESHPETVEVIVHRCRHLPGVDRGKTSDPYVVIEFAGSIRKSKVCKKTLSPVWDFRCEFDYEPGEVKISVYDWNLVMRRKLLGVVTVDARTAGPLAAERWHKLEGSVSGEALVTVRRARGGGGNAATSPGETASPESVDWSQISRRLF